MSSRSWPRRRSGRRSASTGTNGCESSTAPAAGVSRLARGRALPARGRGTRLSWRAHLGHPGYIRARGDRKRSAEATATIVHRVLAELGIETRVLLWNVVPTHPGTESTNRPATRAEVEEGLPFVHRLAGGRRVIAVGRLAEAALGAPYITTPLSRWRRSRSPPPENRALLLAFLLGGRLVRRFYTKTSTQKTWNAKNGGVSSRLVCRGRRGKDPGPSRRRASRTLRGKVQPGPWPPAVAGSSSSTPRRSP